MEPITEKKLVYYTALFIAVIFNIAKLMALRPDALINKYWHFNAYELVLQAVINFALCIAAAFANLRIAGSHTNGYAKTAQFIGINVLLSATAGVIGIGAQTRLFYAGTGLSIFKGAYMLRLLASQALMGILVKIILLMRESREKDRQNEQLRTAYLNAQLQLLKEELNPHFFFNALSSLSAVVRENPKRAQMYISHLSKIFRYTLHRQEKNLVLLQEELTACESYFALLKMRLEDALIVSIDVPQEYMHHKVAYMSLQPLIENAAKHNAASIESPLIIRIYVEGGFLIVQNNLQPLRVPVEGTGIGLANLNERFSILLNRDIEITKTDLLFTVKLPLGA